MLQTQFHRLGFFWDQSFFVAFSTTGYAKCPDGMDDSCYTQRTTGTPPVTTLFFGATEVAGVDLKTFQLLNATKTQAASSPCSANCPVTAKDKNNVFIRGIRFTEPDAESFRYLGSVFFSDKNHVYFSALMQFQRGITSSVSHLHILKGLDPNAFHEAGGYWQDEKTIVVDLVHHLTLRKNDFKDYGAGYVGDGTHIYTTGCYTNGLLVQGADVQSFKGLSPSVYAVDRANAYWCGLKISGKPDLETFHVDERGNACDKLGCFQYGNRKTVEQPSASN